MKHFYRFLVIMASILFFPAWILTVVTITVILTPISMAEYMILGECGLIKKIDELLFDICGETFFKTIEKFSKLTK